MMFSHDEEHELLSLAKSALWNTLNKRSDAFKMSKKESYNLHLGVFVSLYKNGDLRGCIGRIISDIPLIETLQTMAIQAGLSDHRFSPVTSEEFDQLSFEITVLSPLKRLHHIDEIQLGTHGLYLRNGGHSSVFLPQVPLSQGWDLKTYLEQLSIKAGLPPRAWTQCQLFSFEGHVFSD